MIRLLYVAFALSGAAGLVYESIWTRYLGLFVGHSAYAQIIVLVIFLGGMALGAFAAGRWSARLRDPLAWYAGAELAAGLAGLAFHRVYVATTEWAYDSIFPALAGAPSAVAVKWALAGALILPQSIVLGATFPLMAAGVLRRVREAPGRTLAGLYFVNGLGGAAGVLVAGFYLVGAFGLPGTVAAAGWLNVLVALLSAGAVWKGGGSSTAGGDDFAGGAPDDEQRAVSTLYPRPSTLVLLTVAFGTAVASFIYEIAWVRMLSLVLGSATHSFELMLSAFVLGLSLGAFWVRTRTDRFTDPVRALGVIQCAMGVLAIATLPLYLASFRWTAALLTALNRTPEGYVAFTIAKYAVCLAIMLPATFCAGMTLPLITRILLRGPRGEAAIGTVYAVNTVGSVAGAELGGLVLMPLIGLKAMLVAGAALDVALGASLLVPLLLSRPRGVTRLTAAAASTIIFAATIAWTTRFDRELLVSGVYRSGRIPPPGARRVVYYRDGATATISAHVAEDGLRSVATNGKGDASLSAEWVGPRVREGREELSGDGSTQALLALITLAHVPGAREAAVIGHGSGMSSHLLLGSPRLRRLETIEIEPEMIRASQIFFPYNARVFNDPRSRFVIDDAKAHLAAAGRKYDLVLSEPSNPWVSGVSGLFTVEFYRRVRQYLAEGGVFGQWLHLYEIDDALVLSVLAAIHEVFPSYEVFTTGRADVLIVATGGARLPRPDWGVVRQDSIAADLRRFVPLTPQTLDALRVTTREVLAPLLMNAARPNSDYHPLLDLGAERARFVGTGGEALTAGLTARRFDPFAALTDRRMPFGHEPVTPMAGIARPRALARGAFLRAALRGRIDDVGARDPAFVQALLRLRMHETFMARGAAPPDWRDWVRNLAVVENDIHAGTAGVADERFYAAVFDYLQRARAPSGAVHAVEFLHAAAVWDFPTAARLGDWLMLDATLGESWVPLDLFRDAVVVAKLRTGDQAGASKAFTALGDQLGPNSTDLRSRLLGAHILTRAAQP